MSKEQNNKQMILGIDVGGTSVKFGLVTPEGEIQHATRFMTADWVNGIGFVESMKKEIGEYLKKYPVVKGVGIGWPGLLSLDRTKVVLLPNIPSIVNVPIVEILRSEFPQIHFKIENDAKCAALGEYYFGSNKQRMQTFLLLALGTGVGSGVMMSGKLFLGGRGNGTEVGHMLTTRGKSLENQVGINHLIAYTKEQLALDTAKKSSLHKEAELSPKVIADHVSKGDALAIAVWNDIGTIIGESLVNIVRVMDINNILLGGGISGAFDYFVPNLKKAMLQHLPTYYTDDMYIGKATLENDAGLLGAAGLIMEAI
ncbi:ROK family protein [Cytophaga aurantiaca]|uniref:ROK family protein n=1 Tax=Cytophaga aurantiaca TaxID=29530 RepID=UPI000360B92F|nr:ROK family protein [Cytophaga aurantiaca]